MDYNSLVGSKSTTGSIANYINRSDLPLADILTEAEAFIYQHMRVREMRADEALTFPQGDSSVALPAGFLDPISFTPRTWGRPLDYVHEQMLGAVRDTSGNLFPSTPSRWTINGDTAYVDVSCLQDFAGRLLYYKQPDPLSGANTTNFLTRRYPKVLRYGCMAVGFEHAKDRNLAPQYVAAAMAAIQDAMATDDLARRGQQ